MTWRDRILPASFRGQSFFVARHEAAPAGRRLQVHEYPGSDDQLVEDLGRKTKRYQVEAFVLGDDYIFARDALLDACDRPGPGRLIHPYLGAFDASCEGVKLVETSEEGGIATLTIDFVRGGANKQPIAVPDTAAAIEAAAAIAAAAAVGAQFLVEYDL